MVVAKLLIALTSVMAAGQEPQLLCFGASWCQPCQQMQPTLDRLAQEGFPIRKLDVDQHGELAARYRINSVPAIVLVDGQGRPVDQIMQATDYNTLRRFLAHYRIQPVQTTVRGQNPVGIPTNTAPPSTPVAPVVNHSQVANVQGVQAQSLMSTVRLRVEDEGGHSFGTGTVIDLHGQEALVITCGHIFRESDGKGRILMQRFDTKNAEPAVGTLISYDMDRDVALVSMKLTRPIQVAKLADSRVPVQPGEPVYSIGCNQGAPPTVMQGSVNQVDKYLGPSNITASGRPVVGRSGGGLFNAKGELIGVCSAADPEIDEGLYGALPRVIEELDHNGLTFVYQKQHPDQQRQPVTGLASRGGVPSSTAPSDSNSVPSTTEPNLQPAGAHVPAPTAAATTPTKTSRELVCILKGEDGSEGQAYVIEAPSDVLLEYLRREAKSKR